MVNKMSFILTPQADVPELKVVNKNKKWMYYGENNLFPYEIYNLYEKSSIMTAVVGTMCDFICGDEIVNNTGFKTVNRNGDTLEDLIRKCANDYALFGGFAIQVIRNKGLDKIAELNWMDMRHIRVDKDITNVWYNDWSSKKRKEPIMYPVYIQGTKQPNSVFYFKGLLTRTQYPLPMYIGSLTALQVSTEIDNYQLHNILNNFTPSAIINFNSGSNLGEDEIEEIENKVYEKFSGTSNAGKIMICFNDNAESATTVERLADDNLENKYNQLVDTITNSIYAGFRINPVLTGLNKTNSAFTKQEFSEAASLYNKTVIYPIQKQLIDAFEKLFGKGCIEIKPFEVKFDTPAENTNNTEAPNTNNTDNIVK